MVSDGGIRISAPITPIRRLSGDSAPLDVINTEVTRGRMEFHSRGGGNKPARTNPQKKKIQEKKSEGKSRLGRSLKFPHGELRSS